MRTTNPNRKPVGGNGLFCRNWDQYGFSNLPVALAVRQESPRLVCASSTDNNPGPRCVSLNASGGTAPYSWTRSKGVLSTPTGDNSQNVQLTPPANPGSSVNGVAYKTFVRWNLGTFGCFLCNTQEGHYDYSCNDSRIRNCFGGGCERGMRKAAVLLGLAHSAQLMLMPHVTRREIVLEMSLLSAVIHRPETIAKGWQESIVINELQQ